MTFRHGIDNSPQRISLNLHVRHCCRSRAKRLICANAREDQDRIVVLPRRWMGCLLLGAPNHFPRLGEHMLNFFKSSEQACLSGVILCNPGRSRRDQCLRSLPRLLHSLPEVLVYASWQSSIWRGGRWHESHLGLAVLLEMVHPGLLHV